MHTNMPLITFELSWSCRETGKRKLRAYTTGHYMFAECMPDDDPTDPESWIILSWFYSEIPQKTSDTLRAQLARTYAHTRLLSDLVEAIEGSI